MPLPLAGDKVLAADWTDVFALGVDAWTAYTPTLTQSATITKTVTSAQYSRSGRIIVGQATLVATSAGTAANAVLVGLPVASAGAGPVGGQMFVLDASTGIWHVGPALMATTTSVGMAVQGATGFFGASITIASGDNIRISFQYEAAS